MEKATLILQQKTLQPEEHKKLKYWIKIARKMSADIGKESEMEQKLKGLQDAHKEIDLTFEEEAEGSKKDKSEEES
jgi:hypothetical protein